MSARAGFRDSAAREIAFLRGSPWDLALLTWIPFALCAVLAWQLSGGVPRGLPVAVVDEEGGALGRALAQRLDAAPGLAVVARTADRADAERQLRSRAVYAAVILPRGTTRDALTGDGRLLLLYNASYPTAAGAVRREVGAVVDALNARLLVEYVAAHAPPGAVRPPPLAARTALAWNPAGSYELQLVSLLHPAILHLLFMLAVVSALGRELRDGTIGEWRPGIAAVLGKAAPYAAAYGAWALVTIAYLAIGRGWTVQGSFTTLIAGYAAMYAGYLGVALLAVGATKAMGTALSLTGVFAGASFAFSGAIFPLEQASEFARTWSALLPYSAFAHVVALEWFADAPATEALASIGRMLLIAAVAGALGLKLYLVAASRPETWGRR
jgi:ABC-2 type transport system permease protein